MVLKHIAPSGRCALPKQRQNKRLITTMPGKDIGKELLSYLLVGAAATALHYLILVFLVQKLMVAVTSASVVGAAAGAVAAFAGNEKLTFGKGQCDGKNQRFLKFLSTAGMGVALNGALMWQLALHTQWPYLLSQLATSACVVMFTYSVNKKWTFR
jgi:putative flippase GtrA